MNRVIIAATGVAKDFNRRPFFAIYHSLFRRPHHWQLQERMALVNLRFRKFLLV